LNPPRPVLTLVLTLGLLAPLLAAAQQVKTAPRIGFLSPATASQRRAELDAFWQGMRGLGYVEGQNLVVEYRWAEGRFDRLPKLADELVHLGVSVIVAHTTPGALAAKQAAGTIPVVMTNAGDPVGSHLVASLAKPGGNVTGLSMLNIDLGGKRVELLREVVPGLSRIFVLWNPDNHGNVLIMKNTEIAARVLGVQLHSFEVRRLEDLEHAFVAITGGHGSALMVIEDPITLDHRNRVADFAARNRLPAVYGLAAYVKAGGLLSYGIHLEDLFRRSAYYVDKILKGAKPADLPVEQPTKFELVISVKTAKALGLTIPPSMLGRADELIQ
jgi:putative ABC transport system substrate-binding protein